MSAERSRGADMGMFPIILLVVVIGFILLVGYGTIRTGAMREAAAQRIMEAEIQKTEAQRPQEDKSMEERPMVEDKSRVKQERVPRPINLAGAMSRLILAGILIALAVYIFTPSEVREYRVEFYQAGIYRVRGIVQFGRDFTAYQSIDGKEAIETCNQLNAELIKDRGGSLRAGRVAWRQ